MVKNKVELVLPMADLSGGYKGMQHVNMLRIGMLKPVLMDWLKDKVDGRPVIDRGQVINHLLIQVEEGYFIKSEVLDLL